MNKVYCYCCYRLHSFYSFEGEFGQNTPCPSPVDACKYTTRNTQALYPPLCVHQYSKHIYTTRNTQALYPPLCVHQYSKHIYIQHAIHKHYIHLYVSTSILNTNDENAAMLRVTSARRNLKEATESQKRICCLCYHDRKLLCVNADR